jgi:fused signal recognition particle receptor
MADAFKKGDSTAAQPGWLSRLKTGLARTGGAIGGLFERRRIDQALFDELEAVLLAADAGVAATQFLSQRLRARAAKEGLAEAVQLKAILADELVDLLSPLEKSPEVGDSRPWVIMLVGVNGAGKTTSIGKLAKHYRDAGFKLLLAAGDTFRAAAREQLTAWGERNGVAVISQQGGDPGAVMFDTVQAARARGVDIVLADTAGRLPTQLHLMEELKKIKRVLGKAQEGAPHEVWLVIDANTGQNAVTQVKAFDDALGLTGLILTKLDGTAKGGVIAAIALARSSATLARSSGDPVRPNPSQVALIASQRPVPLAFIGVGEQLDDLQPFVAREFVPALLD